MDNGIQNQQQVSRALNLKDFPLIEGKQIKVEIIRLGDTCKYPGRIAGIPCGETIPLTAFPENNDRACYIRPKEVQQGSASQEDLFQFEHNLRRAALSTHEMFLLGLNAMPTVEVSPGNFEALYQPNSSLKSAMTASIGRGGIYQLM